MYVACSSLCFGRYPLAQALHTITELHFQKVDLALHESEFAATAPAAREHRWHAVVDRLEGNLSGWQTILGDMADRVRVAHEDLAGLDADLNRALASFTAARKFLQG